VKTPQERFDELPTDTRQLVTDVAIKHDVGPMDLFADQAKRAASDLARKIVARKLHEGGMSVADVAELFGVSRVSINNAVRADK
jgi:hypothetical protein